MDPGRLLALFLLLAPAAAPQVRRLTILHTNDLHARLLPDEEHRGGFAYVASVLRREKTGCEACLLLNAGDFVQGSPVSTIFKGLPVLEIVRHFGYDASTLGNHEFDYGWQTIPRYVERLHAPVISSNIVDADGRFLVRPYLMREVGGIRVAIVGAMLNDLAHETTPALLGPWHTLPVIETVRKYAAELRGRSDLIVVLGHISTVEEKQMLKDVPDVAVVVSGHDHRGLEVPAELDGRVVVRVKRYGVEIGRLDMSVDVPKKRLASWKWRRIPVDADTVPPAPDIAALVDKWEARVQKVVDQPIGESKREISGKQLKALIERAMREETGADFAFMNQGGIRDRIPQGRILARHVWNIMPFDNLVLSGTFKGSQLPRAVTQNLQIDPGRVYTLAVSDFTVANQDAQLHTTDLKFPRTGPMLRDLLISWIKKKRVLE